MNRLEEIQELIKKFIYEKQQMRQEINAIEEKRNVLAQERNNKINENKGNAYTEEVQARIFELGNKIKELGNQSQELQNKLDKKYLNIKNEVSNEINSNIASIMPGVREKEEKRFELQQLIEEKEKRDARYLQQKQEFYNRFGRIPVLSENAMKENELQEEEYRKNKLLIEELDNEIKVQEEEISKAVKVANDFKRGNWKEYIDNNKQEVQTSNNQEILESYAKKIVEEVINPIVEEIVGERKENIEDKNLDIQEVQNNLEEDSIILPFVDEEKNDSLEEVKVEEIEQLQEVKVEETEPLQEVKVEEIEPLQEVKIEETEPLQEVKVEEIEPLQEVKVEEIEPLQEVKIEEIEPLQEEKIEKINLHEENNIVEIEPIEEITAEEMNLEEEKTLEELLAEQEEKVQQTSTQNIQEIEEKTNEFEKNQEDEIKEIEYSKNEEDIITYENEEETENVGTYFGEKVNLLNINAKFEDGEVVYKAQTSNGDCIKVYPRKAQTGNILLKGKENREELKEILINYAIAEYRMFDKKVVKKIDPSVCEVLIKFAKKYNYDAQSLIYNYAMSFSKNEEIELENVPTITYNFVYMQETNLSKKEKDVIAKICKNARKNSKIDIVGYNTGIKKIKYMLKRTFSVNDANALPEGKY